MNNNKEELIKDQLIQIKLISNDLKIKEQENDILKTKLIQIEDINEKYKKQIIGLENNLELKEKEYFQIKENLDNNIYNLEENNRRLYFLKEELIKKELENNHYNRENENLEKEKNKLNQEILDYQEKETILINNEAQYKYENELFVEKINLLNNEKQELNEEIYNLNEISKKFEEEKQNYLCLENELRIIKKENIDYHQILQQNEKEIQDIIEKNINNEEIIKKYEKLFYDYNIAILNKEVNEESVLSQNNQKINLLETENSELKQLLIQKDQDINKITLLYEKIQLNIIEENNKNIEILENLSNIIQKEDLSQLKSKIFEKDYVRKFVKNLKNFLKQKLKYKKAYKNCKTNLMNSDKILSDLKKELEFTKEFQNKSKLENLSEQLKQIESTLKKKEKEFIEVLKNKDEKIEKLENLLDDHINLIKQKEYEKMELLSLINSKVDVEKFQDSKIGLCAIYLAFAIKIINNLIIMTNKNHYIHIMFNKILFNYCKISKKIKKLSNQEFKKMKLKKFTFIFRKITYAIIFFNILKKIQKKEKGQILLKNSNFKIFSNFSVNQNFCENILDFVQNRGQIINGEIDFLDFLGNYIENNNKENIYFALNDENLNLALKEIKLKIKNYQIQEVEEKNKEKPKLNSVLNERMKRLLKKI